MAKSRWFSLLAMLPVVPASMGLAATATAAPAEPAGVTHYRFGFKNDKVTANKNVKFHYSVSGDTRGQLVLQRTFGTAQVFKTVQRLSKTAHLGTAKVPEMGAYDYRVALIRHRRLHSASSAKPLFSYGTVQLGTLLRTGSRTVSIGGHLYRYVWVNYDNGRRRIIKRDKTSCRSLSLSMALKDENDYGTPRGGISVIQETADPVSKNAVSSQVVQMGARLSGDAFTASGTADNYGYLYVNGTASCYTTNGNP